MTKLLEWLSVAAALFGIWSSIVFGYVKSPFLDNHMNKVILSPIFAVLMFGVYAASVVLYRVFTFNNCEKAAEELQKHIAEARKDLERKGFVSS